MSSLPVKGDDGGGGSSEQQSQGSRSISRINRSGPSWIDHVSEVHSRITPQQRTAWTTTVEAAQSREKSSRRVTEIKRSNVSMQTSWSDGMTRVTSLSSRARTDAAAQRTMYEAAQSSVAAITAVSRSLTAPMSAAPKGGEASRRGDVDVAEEVEAEVLVNGARAPEEPGLQEKKEEFAKLAEDLRVEPDTDAERAAKFMLYEKLLEGIEAVRRETFSFWAEAKVQFKNDGARREMERKIADLDSVRHMGFEWVEGRWFVFDMTLKAQANAQRLDRLLAEIRAKLELLGRSDECPVCLEGFEDDTGHAAVVLGCCHKVCQECWSEWTKVNGGRRPFCPLCRHEEFLTQITELHSRRTRQTRPL